MAQVPLMLHAFFALITLLTVLLFCRAIGGQNAPPGTLKQIRRMVALILCLWLLIQGMAGAAGFYTLTTTTPPRFVLLAAPPLLCIILLLITGKGRAWLDTLDLRRLTLLHIMRIPVELALMWLSICKAVPPIMTFEGRNPDILSGITALLIWRLAFRRDRTGRVVLLIWNFVCLGLLINIIAIAVLSVSAPWQRLAFDQPNAALLYFPYVWLPCCIVPLVLLAHVAAIRQLLRRRPGLHT